jgi:drug/metabolite transporter (DMT)-like permease
MAPFFALVMSYLFLRDVERVTGLVVAGTALSVAGGVIIGWRVL